MEVKIYNSITEIDENEWNSIVGRDRIICTHKYLEAIEKSNINDCKYYYPVVYDEEGRIVAHTCVYSISTELDTFAQGPVKKIIKFIRRGWNNFLILRSLECGTPVAAGNTISFREGIDKEKTLGLIVKEIEGLAKKLKVSMIAFRDFFDDELSFFNEFIKYGYAKVNNLPLAKMEVRWQSFDEYLKSMRSNYRTKIIKRMKRCNSENISMHVVKDFSQYADEMENLWLNVNRNAKEYSREKLTSGFFKSIDQHLKENSSVILAKKDDTLVGFASLLSNYNKTLVSMYFGLNYNYNKEYNLYFNLLYKIIELGIENKMKDIDLGITTLIPKKDVGADVITMNIYMKHLNPLLNRIVPRVFKMVTPQDNTGIRRVFKHD